MTGPLCAGEVSGSVAPGVKRRVGCDRVEFADFYRTSWDPCLRAVTASLGDPRLAEDLVAEAFAKAWVSWRDVRNHPAPRAWIVRTSLNTGVSWWRRRRHEVTLTGREPGPGEKPGQAARLAGPAGMDTALLGAVRRLPAREREVVVLRVFLDLDTETTAKQLGIATGTVRAHLSRAIATLRQEVDPVLTMEA
ncbi:MAG TPA: SigE family RNA polymerase sigma factor [Acidimicrobiales bacterium]|nr:SigE family RNA polymerase sigma factor [Acidimicrobiales bacterium]